MFSDVLARFGSMAVWLGIVDEVTVAKALKRQRDSGRRLGEELEESGFLSAENRETVLEAQRLAQEAGAVAAMDLDVTIDSRENRGAVVELRGVLDGLHGGLQRLDSEGKLPQEVFALSLQEVSYMNNRGLQAMLQFWGERPFVLCEIPPLYQVLLNALGVDALVPVAPTRYEACELLRERGEEMAAATEPALRGVTAADAESGVHATPPSPTLEVEMAASGDEVILTLRGTLEAGTALRHTAKLRSFLAEHQPERIGVDLTELEECHHDGFVLFGEFADTAEVFLAAGAVVSDHLTLVGFDEAYPVFDTAGELREALRSAPPSVSAG